ncbi:MAG: hypothetical protein FJX02_09780 [Alphaproteobacteria bacterium]|nr:hypothetical protein [Alphaproteobacteria bacterium]
MGRLPRPLLLGLGAALVLFGIAVSQGWIRDPDLASADFIGTVEVGPDDARQYRAVPFEWATTDGSNRFSGRDTVHVRIDTSGELTLVCGWYRLGDGGQSLRAARWLSEAHLKVGDLRLRALLIAPVEKPPGDGLRAGCVRLAAGLRPAADAALALDGAAVREKP